jgi:hypothetical protein
MAEPVHRAGWHPVMPDGRCFVVRRRLSRMIDPSFTPATREALVPELMVACRAADTAAEAPARDASTAPSTRSGSGGPSWSDGAPKYNPHLTRTTPYADWFAGFG